MGDALVDNLLLQEEVKLKELCKPIVKIAKKQSSLFKNRRIHVENFFEYKSDEDKHKFYVGYFIRIYKDSGIFTKSLTYALICHLEIVAEGSYSIDETIAYEELDFSSVKIIIDNSLENNTNFITPLGKEWPFLRNLSSLVEPNDGFRLEKPFLPISRISNNAELAIFLPILSQIDSLKEKLSDEFNIPVNKIKVITKD